MSETETDTIKHEGDQWILYTAEGDNVGAFPTQEKAEGWEAALAGGATVGTRMAAGLVKKVNGDVVVLEGGRYLLNEAAGDLARMKDGELQKLRALFSEKRQGLRQRQSELGDAARYGTPEGSALYDDLSYYSSLISRIECEMSCRMLTLD